MRTLATLMVSLVLVTSALFAHAVVVAAAGPSPVAASKKQRDTAAVDARERYDELVDDLCARNDDVEPAKMMGMPCVKRGGKMVAGYTEDAMVFKLPDAKRHAEALALDGAHLFDPSGKDQPFKEWVVVPVAHAERWEALAEHALRPAG